jgi:hypothetical protein
MNKETWITSGSWPIRSLKMFCFAGLVGTIAIYVIAFIMSGFDPRALGLVGWNAGLKAVFLISLMCGVLGPWLVRTDKS